MEKYYRIMEVNGRRAGDSELLLFEVRKSTIEEGPYALRAFGPASFALCQQFVGFVESGSRDHEARDRVIAEVKA